LRLFKDIFIEFEAFDYMCGAFIKIRRLFEDIFREMEASIRNIRLFQKKQGFLKTFSIELRLFQRIQAFFKYFQINEGFFH
jgi:hypothetical protein